MRATHLRFCGECDAIERRPEFVRELAPAHPSITIGCIRGMESDRTALRMAEITCSDVHVTEDERAVGHIAMQEMTEDARSGASGIRRLVAGRGGRGIAASFPQRPVRGKTRGQIGPNA